MLKKRLITSEVLERPTPGELAGQRRVKRMEMGKEAFIPDNIVERNTGT